jgi:gamma-glutamyl phosphate reductase
MENTLEEAVAAMRLTSRCTVADLNPARVERWAALVVDRLAVKEAEIKSLYEQIEHLEDQLNAMRCPF